MPSSAGHASRVRLELFDHPEDATAARVIDLDPARNRTGDVWHVWVAGDSVRANSMPIAWTARINPKRAIGSISTSFSSTPSPRRSRDCPRGTSARLGDTIRLRPTATRCLRRSMMPAPCRNAYSRRSIFTGMRTVRPGIRGRRRSFMKPMCVALRIHPSSGVEHPGTYRGLMEKIPYFKELGVTAVELMPVQEFNEHQVTGINPQTGQPLEELLGLRSRGLLCA